MLVEGAPDGQYGVDYLDALSLNQITATHFGDRVPVNKVIGYTFSMLVSGPGMPRAEWNYDWLFDVTIICCTIMDQE